MDRACDIPLMVGPGETPSINTGPSARIYLAVPCKCQQRAFTGQVFARCSPEPGNYISAAQVDHLSSLWYLTTSRLILPLFITLTLHRASSHAKMDASVRHNAAPLSVVWSIAWACSMAFRFISRSVVAYRLVVVTLAWPSHWLIVRMSTPARSRCTAVLCLLCLCRHSRHYVELPTNVEYCRASITNQAVDALRSRHSPEGSRCYRLGEARRGADSPEFCSSRNGALRKAILMAYALLVQRLNASGHKR